ncbi:hypothetical protein M2650_04935 [Luteimonas sp. SX5]|uniref:Peptidoglycan-binding protein n=1 Tax=Luteimonas galliterrae TaxID=2940486 RepID=A0ABT0MGJ2_9GAMM|nr:hypothetical protein [Luteimonas galliterrae]MCL1633987.1 hypothetical protein [Luteimonas galliterrae]
MSIDPRLPAEREPLTPEERELAQRLSRLGPSAGPPSSVDARILAAAHDAVASRPRPKPGSARRWPVALGVAASLVLAVGIAWRLRPLPEPPQMRAPAARSAATATVKGPAPAPEYDADVSIQAVPEQAVPEQAEQAPASAESRQDAVTQAPKRDSVPAPQEPPTAIDESRAMEVQAPAPAAPPPPPAPAAAAMAPPAANDLSAADAVMPAEQEAAGAARAKSAASNAQRAAEAPELRREAQAFEDMPIVDADSASDAGDEPPAYANSPEVREAWLRRVRELIAEGNLQQAHDSLHEFQRRYPGQPLPDDLQRFQQTKTDPILP